MKSIDGVLRWRAERNVNGAPCRLVARRPKTRTARGYDEERRLRPASPEDKPSGSIGLSVIFQQPVSERLKNSFIEALASLQIARDNSHVIEHALAPFASRPSLGAT